MNKYFNCWPVIIYTGLCLLQIVISLFTKNEDVAAQIKTSKATYILGQLVSTFTGYCILFVLCYHKLYKLAWFVLFLPIILIIISFVMVFYKLSKIGNEQFNVTVQETVSTRN